MIEHLELILFQDLVQLVYELLTRYKFDKFYHHESLLVWICLFASVYFVYFLTIPFFFNDKFTFAQINKIQKTKNLVLFVKKDKL